MQIATSETRKRFPLSTKKILKKTVGGAVVLIALVVLLSAVLGPVAFIIPSIGTVPMRAIVSVAALSVLAGVIVVLLFVYLYQRWYFAVYFYDLTPDFVIIRKGPITPREITIPYERVQDVYVDQDIFDRLLGLYDVHLSSATVASGAQAHIDGVEKPAADGLRALLLDTVSKKISRHGNR